MSLAFRFVPAGTTAPDPLPAGEVWIDVGNGTQDGVLDHHHGGSPAPCAAALVLLHAERLTERGAAVLVTHRVPDLDAVTGCWLARRLFANGGLGPVEALVDAVARHDRGEEEPSHLGLLFAAALDGVADDQMRLEAGFALLDRVMAGLDAGLALPGAVERAADGRLAAILAEAERAFAADRAQARTGWLVLPEASGGRRRVVAAQFIAPRCRLLKHVYRRHHPGALLVVSWPRPDGQWRHIVSVEAEAGLRLAGLGDALEQAERRAEAGRPFRPGREMLAAGLGRWGGDMAAPWYDGRGHDFTIVDSPSVGGQPASLLPPDAVWDIIRSLYQEPSGP